MNHPKTIHIKYYSTLLCKFNHTECIITKHSPLIPIKFSFFNLRTVRDRKVAHRYKTTGKI